MSHGFLPVSTGYAFDFGSDFDFQDLLIETGTKENQGPGGQSTESSGKDSWGTLCLKNPLYVWSPSKENTPKLEEWQLVPDNVLWYWDLDNTDTQQKSPFFHDVAKELNFCREKLDKIKESYESDRKQRCASTDVPSEDCSSISWCSMSLFSFDCDRFDLPGFSQNKEPFQSQCKSPKQNHVPQSDPSSTSFPVISPIEGNLSSFEDINTLNLKSYTGEANEEMFFSLVQDFSLDSPYWDDNGTPNTLSDKQNELIDEQPQSLQLGSVVSSKGWDRVQDQDVENLPYVFTDDCHSTGMMTPPPDNRAQGEYPSQFNLCFDPKTQTAGDIHNKLDEKKTLIKKEKIQVDDLHISTVSSPKVNVAPHEVLSDKKHGEGDIMRQKKWWSSEIDKKDISFLKVPCVSSGGLVFHGNQDGAIKVGEGSFGTVFLADLYNGRAVYQVVVKDFSPKGVTKPAEILEEARVLMHLSDTMFIPYFYGLLPVATPQQYAIVQEYFARGTSLHNILEDKSLRLSPVSWISLCLQLAVGLDRFHRKGILLNDIKKDNILVDCRNEECVLKYIDMGLASYKTGRVFFGTEDYMQQFSHLAPEVRRLEKTSPASDVYSIGKILISIAKYAPLRQIRDLVSPCLSHCPSNRPHLHEIICQLLTIRDHIYNSCPLVLPRQNTGRRWFC